MDTKLECDVDSANMMICFKKESVGERRYPRSVCVKERKGETEEKLGSSPRSPFTGFGLAGNRE